MRKNLLRGLAITGAATGTTLAMAASAFAGPPFTVSIPGVAAGGTAPIAFVSTSSVSFTAGIALSCSAMDAAGTAHAGTISTSPYTIADITSSVVSGCMGPLGMGLEVSQGHTWHVDATGGPDASGVTRVIIGSISAHVQDSSTHGGICSFDVTGTIGGTFTNSTQILSVTGPSTLNVSNASGCFSLIPNGTTASVTGNFDVQVPPATHPTPGAHYPITIS
jgi:hypothetical protein